MAKTKISEFSTTAGNNTDINSINIAEGCAPSGINDAIRELMRQLKEFQTGGAGDSVNSGGDFSVATNKFTVASATGNTAVAGTLGATGDFAINTDKFTVTASSGNTAVAGTLASTGNFAVNTDKFTVTAASGNTSVAGTLGAAGNFAVNTDKFTVAASSGNTAVAGTFAVTGATTLTGALVANGNSTLGDADTDTVTLNASFVNGTTLKTAKTATNTLALAAYDVDGTAYTNLVTLTAGNSPTLALTSTGVGTINNMSIGATTASTGAFTTLSASGNVTLSGGTANGVLYLNGSKVATSGSALTFDGTNLKVGSLLSTGNLVVSVDNSANNMYVGGGSFSPTELNLQASSFIRSYIGAAEAMRLTSTGLGIGTSSPVSKLHIESSSAESFQIGYSSTKRSRMGTTSAGDLQIYAYETGVGYHNILLASDAGSVAGNVGIGTSSPSERLQVNGNILAGASGQIMTASGAAQYGTRTANSVLFLTNNSEVMRLDSSGNLLVGQTSVGQPGIVSVKGSNGYGVEVTGNSGSALNADYTYGSGTGYYGYFKYGGTLVGSISSTGSSTSYNTTSDYRLKDNQAPLTGSGEFIDALQPKTWNWKQDGSKGVGFIAHEVQAVSPNSVVGEKDAVDEDGKPKYQAMEYGSAEFIGNIIAELQSLRKRLADAGIA